MLLFFFELEKKKVKIFIFFAFLKSDWIAFIDHLRKLILIFLHIEKVLGWVGGIFNRQFLNKFTKDLTSSNYHIRKFRLGCEIFEKHSGYTSGLSALQNNTAFRFSALVYGLYANEECNIENVY